MELVTPDKLKAILDLHLRWLNKNRAGTGDLHDANLFGWICER